jgi:nucleoside-diphosphate-sugar epimerase
MSSGYGLPTLILTGASGLIGKYLLDEFKNDYRIFAIARRSQQECNAPKHQNIAWLRADVSNINSISKTFREIITAGGADYFIHLAAYYDFVNEYHPQYELTNINGTRNILDLSKNLNLKLFLFASSVAACSFPETNNFIDEASPADGLHIYARSKRAGEEMVKEFSKQAHSCIFRLGAVYSDWCEYAPLYKFINTWLGKSWRAKILAGKGNSAIPYIHIRDVVNFFRQILENYNHVKSGEVLVASTEGSTSHFDLYKLATRYYFGGESKPFYMPKFFCGLGIYVINFFKRLFRQEIFEQSWMIKYIDQKLNVKLTTTPNLIKWRPNSLLKIEKRFPFLIERMKSEPLAWQTKNEMILRKTIERVDFNIYSVLADEEDVLIENILNSLFKSSELNLFAHLQNVDQSEMKWFIKLIYRLLLTSLNSNNKLLIQNYFEVSGFSRFKAGYDLDEMTFILKTINKEIIGFLKTQKHLEKIEKEFYFYITLPIEFGIDEAEQQFQSYQIKPPEKEEEKDAVLTTEQNESRRLLEETIWNCLVNRK